MRSQSNTFLCVVVGCCLSRFVKCGCACWEATSKVWPRDALWCCPQRWSGPLQLRRGHERTRNWQFAAAGLPPRFRDVIFRCADGVPHENCPSSGSVEVPWRHQMPSLLMLFFHFFCECLSLSHLSQNIDSGDYNASSSTATPRSMWNHVLEGKGIHSTFSLSTLSCCDANISRHAQWRFLQRLRKRVCGCMKQIH